MSYRYSFTPSRRRSNPAVKWALGAGVFILLIIGVVACRAVYTSTETTHHDTMVYDKERVCDGESCQYLIYTEAGTFKITDSTGILGGPTRFNSSDVYGRIDTDCPATITVIGFRIGLASQYPNVVEVEQTRCD